MWKNGCTNARFACPRSVGNWRQLKTNELPVMSHERAAPKRTNAHRILNSSITLYERFSALLFPALFPASFATGAFAVPRYRACDAIVYAKSDQTDQKYIRIKKRRNERGER